MRSVYSIVLTGTFQVAVGMNNVPEMTIPLYPDPTGQFASVKKAFVDGIDINKEKKMISKF